MTRKTLKSKIKALGGIITSDKRVNFPNLRINSRQEAQDILEVLRYANELQDTEAEFSCSPDEPLDALIAWLNETKDNPPEAAQRQESGDPLRLFDIPRGALPDMFRDFDEAMEQRAGA
jgi:hypothetical protein